MGTVSAEKNPQKNKRSQKMLDNLAVCSLQNGSKVCEGGWDIEFGCAHMPAPPDEVAEVNKEITRYKLESNIRLSQINPLSWWKIHEHKFPKLAKLAKWMLCIACNKCAIRKSF